MPTSCSAKPGAGSAPSGSTTYSASLLSSSGLGSPSTVARRSRPTRSPSWTARSTGTHWAYDSRRRWMTPSICSSVTFGCSEAMRLINGSVETLLLDFDVQRDLARRQLGGGDLHSGTPSWCNWGLDKTILPRGTSPKEARHSPSRRTRSWGDLLEEARQVDEDAFVAALARDAAAVLGSDVERHAPAVHLGHLGGQRQRVAHRGGLEVAQVDVCPDRRPARLELVGDGAHGGAFEQADQVGRGEHHHACVAPAVRGHVLL